MTIIIFTDFKDAYICNVYVQTVVYNDDVKSVSDYVCDKYERP